MSAASNPNILGDLMAEDRVVRLKPGALTFRVVDGEAVLLDIERSEYLGLNSTATALIGRSEVARRPTPGGPTRRAPFAATPPRR